MNQRIKSVVGAEPRREGEYPTQFLLDYDRGNGDKVANILYEEQNLGTYGIGWFVAYRDDGSVIGKMNSLHVEVVYYE